MPTGGRRAGVEADRAATALAELAPGRVDLVVGHADPPDATGESLYAALCARDPALATRPLFLARDPHTPAIRRLRALTVALPKPLALDELVAALIGLVP